MHETSAESLDFSELISHHLADHHLWMLGARFGFTKQMLMMSVAGVLAAILVLIAARVPGKIRTTVDFYVLFIRQDIVAPALGKDADLYLPYFLTLFLFIFCMNLMGLIPG